MSKEFFRRIENPNEIRKKILESSKETIHTLKSYQKILDIRERKTTTIKQLKIELKEINMLVDKLRDYFPAELVAEFKETYEKKQKSNKKVSKGKKKSKEKKVKKVVQVSEVTKLESKLSEIENKLKSLS